MDYKTYKWLCTLQNMFTVLAGAIIIYLGFVIALVPASRALVNILRLFFELEMPYLFFGYIFIFMLYVWLFIGIYKVAVWVIDNLQADKKEDV